MMLGFVAEDLQQLRIERFDRLHGRTGGNRLVSHGAFTDRPYRGRGHFGRGRRQLALGIQVRGGGKTIHVVALALGLGGVLVDQLRHQVDDRLHHLLHRGARFDAAIEHAVEQVLDRPGEFADDQRADHAAAALERMEGTTDLGQRLLVL